MVCGSRQFSPPPSKPSLQCHSVQAHLPSWPVHLSRPHASNNHWLTVHRLCLFLPSLDPLLEQPRSARHCPRHVLAACAQYNLRAATPPGWGAQRTGGDAVVHDGQAVDAHGGGGRADVQQLVLRLQAHAVHLAHVLLDVRDLWLHAIRTTTMSPQNTRARMSPPAPPPPALPVHLADVLLDVRDPRLRASYHTPWSDSRARTSPTALPPHVLRFVTAHTHYFLTYNSGLLETSITYEPATRHHKDRFSS